MRHPSASSLLSMIAALCACSSHGAAGTAGTTAGDHGRAGAGGSVAGAAGSDPSSGAGGVGGIGEPSAYRVTIHAAQTILCPGQCTALVATAEHGHAPYFYLWSNDLPESEGPHEVCPEQTTTYEVTVSDTAIDGEEFGRRSQITSASLELQVLDDDACAPDGGLPTGPVERELCSIVLPYEDPNGDLVLVGLGYDSALATDSAGNLYFAGQYVAAFDLGDHVSPSLDRTPKSFLAKYGPDCKLLWAKRYASYAGGLGSVAVGPEDEVVVGGGVQGLLMLDAQTVDRSAESFGGPLVAAFDPSDGTALWAQASGSPSDGSGLTSVAVTSAGDILLSGFAGEGVVIAGHAVENINDGALLALLSSTGEPRFAEVFVGAELYLSSDARSDGAIAVASMNRGPGLTYRDTTLDIPLFHRFVALVDATGELLWYRDLDRDLELSTLPGMSTVQVDRNGDILVTHGNVTTAQDGEIPELISKYDASGNWIGTRTLAPEGSHPDAFRPGRMAVDSLDDVIYFASADSFDPVPPDIGIRGEGKTPNDLVVRKLAPDGTELWEHRLNTDSFQRAWGLTVAADDAIWIGHGEDADIDPFRGALRITKLAP